MPKPLPPTDQLLTLLRTHPQRLTELTSGVSASALRNAPADGEWSAVEVLAHIRSCEDMWGGAIQAILAEAHPSIRAINPRTWIEQTDYRDLGFAPSLRAFRKQRTKLLATLTPLSPKDWQRSATVTGAGKPLELTVHHYAERLTIHERPHVKQIERIVGAR